MFEKKTCLAHIYEGTIPDGIYRKEMYIKQLHVTKIKILGKIADKQYLLHVFPCKKFKAR